MTASLYARRSPERPAREDDARLVAIHPLLREILLARREVIRERDLRVALELNARPAEVARDVEPLKSMLSRALDELIASSRSQDRLVIRTSASQTATQGAKGFVLTISCGERSIEKTFEDPFSDPEERSPDISGESPTALASALASEPTTGEHALVKHTVLLVDDDSDTVTLLSRALERRGYAVLTAGSVSEAVAVCAEHSFDVLVSDLNLSDGTGVELIAKLGNPRRAIALSGTGSDEDATRLLEAGYRKLLTKPVTLSTVEAAIGELVLLD